MAANYKQTLLLPKIDSPLKVSLTSHEPDMLGT
jgi:hypothetical protein